VLKLVNLLLKVFVLRFFVVLQIGSYHWLKVLLPSVYGSMDKMKVYG